MKLDPARSKLVVLPGLSARAISTHMLRITRDYMFDGDADRFADLFHLPQEKETLTGRRTIRTRDEMRRLCLAMSRHFHDTGITHLERHCLQTEFITPDQIVTSHQSRSWRGDELVSGPFNSFGMLKRLDGTWKIVYSRYAITDNPLQDAVLLGLHEG